MKKLGALDANFLYSETTLMPNHIASVQRFELTEGVTTAQFIASLKTYLLARMHRVPYMGRKLKLVPGNFDHPFWVHDNQFDIDNHVVEVAVAAPGGRPGPGGGGSPLRGVCPLASPGPGGGG